jgi:fibronectin type 3 domain-containing protein
VTVAMLDVFPPNAPSGLVASPGFAGNPAGAQRPAIDLSWEPGLEPRIAGYRVYRREGDNGPWLKLDAALVPVPAYQDATVEPGRRYSYRVTAVDETGNESTPSPEVVETAPGP